MILMYLPNEDLFWLILCSSEREKCGKYKEWIQSNDDATIENIFWKFYFLFEYFVSMKFQIYFVFLYDVVILDDSIY